MDTSAISLLFFYIVILAMAATVVALTIVDVVKVTSSREARKSKSQDAQKEKPALASRAKTRPVSDGVTGGSLQERTLASRRRVVKFKPPADERQAEAAGTAQTPSLSGETSLQQSRRIQGVKRSSDQHPEPPAAEEKEMGRSVSRTGRSVRKVVPSSGHSSTTAATPVAVVSPEAQVAEEATPPDTDVRRLRHGRRLEHAVSGVQEQAKEKHAKRRTVPRASSVGADHGPGPSSMVEAARLEAASPEVSPEPQPVKQAVSADPERRTPSGTARTDEGRSRVREQARDLKGKGKPVSSGSSRRAVKKRPSSSRPKPSRSRALGKGALSRTRQMWKSASARGMGLWSTLRATTFVRRDIPDDSEDVRADEIATPEAARPMVAAVPDSPSAGRVVDGPRVSPVAGAPGRRPAEELRSGSSLANAGPAGEEHEPVPDAGPSPVRKESESSMDTRPLNEVTESRSERSAPPVDPGRTERAMSGMENAPAGSSTQPADDKQGGGVSNEHGSGIGIGHVETEPGGAAGEPVVAGGRMGQTDGSGPGVLSGQAAGAEQAGTKVPPTGPDSVEAESSGSGTDESGLGDLAELFAQSAPEEAESGRLAEEMHDVDVSELLREGLGLLSRHKKAGR